MQQQSDAIDVEQQQAYLSSITSSTTDDDDGYDDDDDDDEPKEDLKSNGTISASLSDEVADNVSLFRCSVKQASVIILLGWVFISVVWTIGIVSAKLWASERNQNNIVEATTPKELSQPPHVILMVGCYLGLAIGASGTIILTIVTMMFWNQVGAFYYTHRWCPS